MIGPTHTPPVYPRPVDNMQEDPAPARIKRSLETSSTIEPTNSTTNDRSRRRSGGGIDSLGRGNLL